RYQSVERPSYAPISSIRTAGRSRNCWIAAPICGVRASNQSTVNSGTAFLRDSPRRFSVHSYTSGAVQRTDRSRAPGGMDEPAALDHQIDWNRTAVRALREREIPKGLRGSRGLLTGWE